MSDLAFFMPILKLSALSEAFGHGATSDGTAFTAAKIQKNTIYKAILDVTTLTVTQPDAAQSIFQYAFTIDASALPAAVQSSCTRIHMPFQGGLAFCPVGTVIDLGNGQTLKLTSDALRVTNLPQSKKELNSKYIPFYCGMVDDFLITGFDPAWLKFNIEKFIVEESVRKSWIEPYINAVLKSNGKVPGSTMGDSASTFFQLFTVEKPVETKLVISAGQQFAECTSDASHKISLNIIPVGSRTLTDTGLQSIDFPKTNIAGFFRTYQRVPWDYTADPRFRHLEGHPLITLIQADARAFNTSSATHADRTSINRIFETASVDLMDYTEVAHSTFDHKYDCKPSLDVDSFPNVLFVPVGSGSPPTNFSGATSYYSYLINVLTTGISIYNPNKLTLELVPADAQLTVSDTVDLTVSSDHSLFRISADSTIVHPNASPIETSISLNLKISDVESFLIDTINVLITEFRTIPVKVNNVIFNLSSGAVSSQTSISYRLNSFLFNPCFGSINVWFREVEAPETITTIVTDQNHVMNLLQLDPANPAVATNTAEAITILLDGLAASDDTFTHYMLKDFNRDNPTTVINEDESVLGETRTDGNLVIILLEDLSIASNAPEFTEACALVQAHETLHGIEGKFVPAVNNRHVVHDSAVNPPVGGSFRDSALNFNLLNAALPLRQLSMRGKLGNYRLTANQVRIIHNHLPRS